MPQVTLRVGQRVTQTQLVGVKRLLRFAGTIIESPDTERGCRTKMTVKVNGDITKLWQNWSHGLQCVTCYGNLVPDLKRLLPFQGNRVGERGVRLSPVSVTETGPQARRGRNGPVPRESRPGKSGWGRLLLSRV